MRPLPWDRPPSGRGEPIHPPGLFGIAAVSLSPDGVRLAPNRAT